MRAERWTLLAVFVIVFGVYLVSPVAYYGDGRLAGPTAASLVTDGDLDVDEFADLPFVGGYQTTEVDGHRYDFYPWTRSIFAVPVAAALEVGGRLGLTPTAGEAVRSETWEPLLLLVPGAFATALAVVAIAYIAGKQIDDDRRRRRVVLATAGIAAFCTPYWSTASRGMWQHGPACLWLTIAIGCAWAIDVGRRPKAAPVALGAAVAAAALTRPTFVFFAVGLGAWLLIVHRGAVIRAAAGFVAVAGAVVVVNLATFGSLVMPYYDTSRASKGRPDPLLAGLVASVASPSRGMLVYLSAVLALAGWGLVLSLRADQQVSLRMVLAACSLVLVTFTSMSPEGWWAGHSFGARFAVDVVPVLLFLAIPAIDRFVWAEAPRWATVAVTALLVWSVFVHVQGAAIRQGSCWNTQPVDIDVSREQVWDLADSQAVSGARWVLAGNSPLRTSCSTPA